MPFICLYLQVNTNVQEAGVNEYFLTLEDALSVNHIVVFLTGQIPFSEGFGGSIYLGWPAEGGGVSWQLLGFISNSKPSAIFKITKVTSPPHQSESLLHACLLTFGGVHHLFHLLSTFHTVTVYSGSISVRFFWKNNNKIASGNTL